MATTFPAARQPLVAAGRTCVASVKVRLTPVSLKSLSVWEADFRGGDRTGQVVYDFWYCIDHLPEPCSWICRLRAWRRWLTS
jgi:hypothetical protein